MYKANIFLVTNLGSEMLYVIDQRLKAQRIPPDKSAQVLRDLTQFLLDQRFLDQLISAHKSDQLLLSVNQMRILMADIACSSLMRLDKNSMDKLWDLMVSVYKWQLFAAKNDPHRLLNVTFKHLDGIGQLMPEMKKSLAIDQAKLLILNFWDSASQGDKLLIQNTIHDWLKPFRTKISILIRLGLQDNNSSNFVEINPNGPLKKFLANVGENVYRKHPKRPSEEGQEPPEDSSASQQQQHYESGDLFDDLEQLRVSEESNNDDDNGGEEPTDANCSSHVVLDLIFPDVQKEKKTVSGHEFVQIRSTHVRDDVPINLTNYNIQEDLVEIMKIPPYFSKH